MPTIQQLQAMAAFDRRGWKFSRPQAFGDKVVVAVTVGLTEAQKN